MTITEISNLTVTDVEALLLERILEKDLSLTKYDVTDQMYEDELVLFKQELTDERTALEDHYNSIKREGDADLTGEETDSELLAMIEVIERDLAVQSYTDLTLVHTEKPELTVEMDSKAILSLIESLKAQEAATIEKLRREDLQARLDALGVDTHKAIQAAGFEYPNLKFLRNVTLVGDTQHNKVGMTAEEAESFMTAVEAAAVTVKAEREAAEADKALEEAAEKMMKRCTDAMKYIVKFNMGKLALGELDKAGLDTLEEMFLPASTKMQVIRPNDAADLIEALDITGTVYTETERTELLNILRGL